MGIHGAELPLCNSDKSQLLVIDVQERLVSVMPKHVREAVITNIGRLIQAAKLLDVPMIGTEQYAKGLGSTIEGVAQHLPPQVVPRDKTCFSCCTAPGFERDITREGRKQVIIAGIEAHICVLQTASGLQQWGYQVFAVADAVCSRHPENTRNALDRMSRAGIQVTNTESVIFEWVGDASHDQFKAIAALVR